jgi:hypothetical protein
MGLAELGRISQSQVGCTASVLRRHALTDIFLFEHGKVGHQFLVYVGIYLAGMKEHVEARNPLPEASKCNTSKHAVNPCCRAVTGRR